MARVMERKENSRVDGTAATPRGSERTGLDENAKEPVSQDSTGGGRSEVPYKIMCRAPGALSPCRPAQAIGCFPQNWGHPVLPPAQEARPLLLHMSEVTLLAL